jgi:hypothetical protein
MALQEGAAGGTRIRVLPETRLLSAVIVPFLVAAWVILYLQPDRTGDLFAWPVSPSMTAMLLGGVYLGGAYFFVRAVFARDWEQVALGFLPVAGFATLMGVATLVHWDRFTSGHVAFWTWSVIYFTSPFLVLLVWWRNRSLSPTTSAGGHRDELELPGPARTAARLLGLLALAIAAVVFVWPALAVEVWPWTLTPLTARVTGAVFVLGGAGVGIARHPEWRSVRLMVQVALVMLALVAGATVRAWDEFDQASVLTWAYFGWLLFVSAGSLLLYVRMEAERRAQRSAVGS